MPLPFEEIQPSEPTAAGVADQYAALQRQWEAATDAAERIAVVRRWDELLRELDTWDSLTQLRFAQDTGCEAYKQAQDRRDELEPRLTELAVDWKRQLLQPPYRDEITAAFGPQAVALWEANIASFDPQIKAPMVAESKICSEYVELLAAAEISFQGGVHNLSEMQKFLEAPARGTRREAAAASFGWYAENRERLDDQFHRLVQTRHEMATALGDSSFVELGYRRMTRVDYGSSEVAAFRESVRQRVTPLCAELVRRQQQTLGLDGPVMYWDEPLLFAEGNPQPKGGYDWMIEQAAAMFDRLGHGLGEFFRLMSEGGYMDLENRAHKAGGGFCTCFCSEGMPFIFANFNGSKGDVEVFTHEVGHAFQIYMSGHVPLLDYLWPTYEACEIHSMGLEFLTWPEMERFFGDDAERYRRAHLEESLRFLPYGAAVDHFQHLVYESPQASPAERHAMWQEMERMYLPWRRYDGLPHVADGGFWQRQRHIYLSPFYYIDYTLALTCAMQLWVRSRQDYKQSLADYAALCRLGGQLPFNALAASAGLRSPFESGCLDEVVGAAELYLAQPE